MSAYTAIDLHGLPKPNVIEPIAPENILQQMRAEVSSCFAANHPIHQALTLESEPINKVLEVWAYRYSLKIAEVNRKARALMLAFATGNDLDHIGVTYYRLERKLLQAEDKNAMPPKPAIYEDDESYRYRLALSVEAMTTAGSAGSYEFHALSASPEVFAVGLYSPRPTEVDVYLASRLSGDVLQQNNADVGVSDDAVTVTKQVLLSDDIRPLTDVVRVHSATAKPYTIEAVVYVEQGISPRLILDNALNELRQYLADNYRPTARIATSRIIGALDVQGVSRIVLKSPSSDVLCTVGEVAQCISNNIIAVSEDS